MTITIDISYMDITVWASFITVGLFIFQVLRFLFKWLSNLYKKGFKKYSGDIAADDPVPDKKGNTNNSIEKADQNNHSKGG